MDTAYSGNPAITPASNTAPSAPMRDEEHGLWPARNIAEYAYCPRLFYYMQVEGIFLPSSDTEQGIAVHRRVDRPSAAQPSGEDEAEPERPRAVRSLALTSARLQLTATLDLAEISGSTAVPVEYRKGRPKHLTRTPSTEESDEDEGPGSATVEPWPTDRVQVGLQALLLEEAGYTVTDAILYYAAEKRRLTIPVDDALKAEALATLEAAQTTARGARPLPLVNDPRCLRCSLQPICLPDEVNQQREAASGTALTPRRIWPPRDDGIHIIAQQNGTKIGVNGLELRVTDKDGVVMKKVPLVNLESLSLLGSVQISTQAIQTLADRGVPIAFLSAAGRVQAMIDPLDSVSAEVRRAQVRQLDRPELALELARALISAKIHNQRTLLLRNRKVLPPDVAGALATEVKRVARAGSLDAVRGHEGQAAAIYFDNLPEVLKDPVAAEFHAHGRQRRPPPDPVNACLSFGYAMLVHECVAALRIARLEPSIGGFHVSRPGRPALALDLMEPFRPLIADSIAIACFNRGELTAGHFLRTAAGCVLTDAGRRAFFSAWGRRMETEVTHPVFGYRLSYRRMIVLHARLIAAWLLGEVPSLAFLTTR